MRFSCEQCSARYSIADERVRGKLVAVRCSKCGAKITVNGKALNEPEPEMPTRVAFYNDSVKAADARADAARAAAPETLADGWFVILDGTQSGPLSAAEMRGMLSSGRISARTYAWRDGQGEWKRASDLPALAVLLTVAPPAPPPLPAAPPRPEAPAPAAQVSAPAPAPRPQAAKPSALGRSLFDGEFESEATVVNMPVDPAALAQKQPAKAPVAQAQDPFAAVSEQPTAAKPGEIGEQTRFLMNKAGVTRRNPAWKVALFVLLLIGLPLAALYLLSNIGIATVTLVDTATGEQVQRPIFSTEGMTDLRQKLLGTKPETVPAPPRKPKPARSEGVAAKPAPKGSAAGQQVIARPDITFGSTGETYQAGELEQLGPRLRPDAAPIHVDGKPGLDEEVIGQTVGKNLKAFQLCNENELRRNPGFKGGKIALTLTIGPSGIVTRATVDSKEIDRSSLGACLKEKAKRVAFPAFEGEAFDVEIPLVLTKGA